LIGEISFSDYLMFLMSGLVMEAIDFQAMSLLLLRGMLDVDEKLLSPLFIVADLMIQ
jgi:hypothetical protein